MTTIYLATRGDAVSLCDWFAPSDAEIAKYIPLAANFQAAVCISNNDESADSKLMQELISQLSDYLQGHRQAFTLPVSQRGTPFLQAVWSQLCQIPYGTTTTYGTLARQLGMPKAVRAVANAVGANRLSILIPCHRVLAASGIGGYRGGLKAKQTLLELELNLGNHPTPLQIQQ